MPLTLFAPGARKGNRYWLVRGSYDGRRIELSTQTTDKMAARRFLRELERELATGQLPKPGEAVSFAEAAGLYAQFRGLDLVNPRAARGRARTDVVAIGRLIAALGKRPIGELRQADLVAAANRLYPERTAATRNREAMRPAAAILHYAARQGWCAWLRVELFREPRPRTRAVALDSAAALVAAAPAGPRRLMLVWLFRQGTRISDTLAVRWDEIDLARQTVRLRIGKTDSWTELPLHPELVELLAAIPAAERAGACGRAGRKRPRSIAGCGRWRASSASPSRRTWRGIRSAPGSTRGVRGCARSWRHWVTPTRNPRSATRPPMSRSCAPPPPVWAS